MGSPSMLPLKIVFMGTAELACPILAALAGGSPNHVLAVVTQPDRPKGRELKLQAPPVKLEAMRRALPILQPERARNKEFIQSLADLDPDLIALAAYGQILPPALLAVPRFGCLNVHTSLLPKYRGAAPIQWAILNDESETGVTIMKMDEGLDTGDILTQEITPIYPADNAQILHDRLAQIGAALLLETIPNYVAGRIALRKQPDEGISYARKIAKEDGQLDWHQPARVLWNRVRAFTPWPGAFTFLPGGAKLQLLKIWETAIESSRVGRPGEVLLADKTGIVVACGQQALRSGGRRRLGGTSPDRMRCSCWPSLCRAGLFQQVPLTGSDRVRMKTARTIGALFMVTGKDKIQKNSTGVE
jgi:methionyl-tRNA formyltransferase